MTAGKYGHEEQIDMSVTATSSATNATNNAGITARVANKTISQDDFLKLLVAQLSTQDPLNPTSETEFTGQLAQFSALEQSKSMGAELVSLREQQEFLQANNLIGRTVALETEDGAEVTGVVSGLMMVAGKPQLVVNGEMHALSEVLAVEQQPTTSQTP